jgi:hypothetical protein
MSVWLAAPEITCGPHSSSVGPICQSNILIMCCTYVFFLFFISFVIADVGRWPSLCSPPASYPRATATSAPTPCTPTHCALCHLSLIHPCELHDDGRAPLHCPTCPMRSTMTTPLACSAARLRSLPPHTHRCVVRSMVMMPPASSIARHHGQGELGGGD